MIGRLAAANRPANRPRFQRRLAVGTLGPKGLEAANRGAAL